MKIAVPVEARVHHRGSRWSAHLTESERRAKPDHGWGTVKEVVPQRDGTFEYRVEKDAPFLPGYSTEGWWASYHIDRWEVIEETS